MPPSNPMAPPAPAAPPPPSQLRPRSSSDRDLLEPDEVVVTVIHKHPIGIIGIYLLGVLVVVAILIIGVYVAPNIIAGFSPTSRGLIIAGGIFAFAILVIVLFVLTYVYRQSKIVVTDRSLIQVIQKSLFIRKISRLSMSNVEDVNAEQRGIFASIFNYGTLMVQTAGTMENFIFPYCPDPNLYADEILEARAQFAKHVSASYDELNPPTGGFKDV